MRAIYFVVVFFGKGSRWIVLCVKVETQVRTLHRSTGSLLTVLNGPLAIESRWVVTLPVPQLLLHLLPCCKRTHTQNEFNLLKCWNLILSFQLTWPWHSDGTLQGGLDWCVWGVFYQLHLQISLKVLTCLEHKHDVCTAARRSCVSLCMRSEKE